MCNCLDNIGRRIGIPRLWLYIGEYKNASKIIAVLVLFLQVIRIVMVGIESPFVHEAYPESETIGFCALSMLLGVVSIGLESLLFYAIQKTNMKKIQPWFLCTVIIFLIASLAFVITSTLYIIRPLDHNSSRYRFKHAFPKNITTTDNATIMDDGNGTTIAGLLTPEGELLNITTNSNGLQEECSTNNSTSTSTCRVITSDEVFNLENTPATLIDQLQQNNSTQLQRNNLIKQQQQQQLQLDDSLLLNPNLTNFLVNYCKPKEKPCKVRVYVPDMEDYFVKPILPLSFLLDVVRCLPQLFFVNRFVKAEQLHEHFMHQSHSHTSLSALYVKPLPLPVLV